MEKQNAKEYKNDRKAHNRQKWKTNIQNKKTDIKRI